MRLRPSFLLVTALLFVFVNYGERAPWTSSHVQGSPEKPPKYRLDRMYPGISFTNPVDLTFSRELKRWFVCEQGGKIFTLDAEGKRRHLAADFAPLQGSEGNLYAIAVDPGFATNRFVYICYVLKSDLPDGSHISRFTVENGEEPIIDLKSEMLLLTWFSGGHNGCCLKFGLDGCLYISTGDGAGPHPADPQRTGQDVTDLLSSVLRIDVRHKENGKNYAVPSDNPFRGDAKARPEIWAYGLRNPWRMGFDAKTGDLWVADVGWELWEPIYKIQRGGNYGWSIMEGHQPALPDQPRGPSPILPPVKDHPHSEAASITGGYVYYGSKYPELKGAFIYGDWETGKIWGLKADGYKESWGEELTDTTNRVVAFAEDPTGEIAVLDYQGGMYSLQANPPPTASQNFPNRLSETGLFRSVEKHELAPGVSPFEVNAAMWSDHATAQRFVALPFDSKISAAERPWRFPSNAVLLRTISMEMERGNARSKKRLETQLLHFTGDGWGAYTYRWNANQTDATLVPKEGAEETLRVTDSSEPGGVRIQTWRFHARAECLRCHNPWCGTALGFQPEQLNREANAGNQLDHFEAENFFDSPPKKAALTLASPYDARADLEKRARSYLHINCSHCHRENAGGSVPSEFNIDLPLAKTHALARPIRGDLGLEHAQVISPGNPFSSVILFRTSSTGRSRMPYLGSKVVDEDGIALLREWIGNLSTTNRATPAGGSLEQLRQELGAGNADCEKIAAHYIGDTSSALALAHAISGPTVPPVVKERVANTAAQSSNPLVQELFERFLPPDKRHSVSQAIATKAQVLALKGDAGRGALLLNDTTRLSCLQCHQYKNAGRAFGPPFKEAGKNKTRGDLYDNILEPSRQIAPQYVVFTAELNDEESLSGIVVNKTDQEVVLRDASATDHHIASASLKSLKAQKLSAMPEGLLAGLSPQDVADIIEVIASEAAE